MIDLRKPLLLTATALLGSLALPPLDSAAADEHCPNQGIRIVPEKILDATDSDDRPVTIECPSIQAGIGVPGWGHFGIGFGSLECPASQTRIEAHAIVVPKEGFKATANSVYKLYTRTVSCETKENFVLLGLPSCKYGEWVEAGEHTDFKEDLCAD